MVARKSFERDGGDGVIPVAFELKSPWYSNPPNFSVTTLNYTLFAPTRSWKQAQPHGAKKIIKTCPKQKWLKILGLTL